MKKMLIGVICLLSMVFVGCAEDPLYLNEENSFQSVMTSEKMRHEVDKFMVTRIDGKVIVLEGSGLGAKVSSEDTLFMLNRDLMLFTYGDTQYYVDIQNLDSERVITFDDNNIISNAQFIELLNNFQKSLQ